MDKRDHRHVVAHSLLPTAAYLFGVRSRLYIFLLAFAAVAANCQFAAAQPPVAANSGQRDALIRTRPSLTGSLENNNGKLRLNLSNNAPREFRGTARLSLGSEADQRELGQVAITLPPQETKLLLLSNAAPAGEQYTLLIHDERGTLVFYKIAPLQRISDDTPAMAVTLLPVTTRASQNTAVASAAPSAADEELRQAAQVHVQARLLADEAAAGSFLVSFELRSPQPVDDATLTVTAGKTQERKRASFNRQAHYEFKLPKDLENERIGYTLTTKQGRVLANGEVDLAQLMADDAVTVSDIRTDRATYEAGATARLTVLLEGKARQGYRLEVLARDHQNQVFFRAEKQAARSEPANLPEFSVTLPGSVAAPLIFEFKIFDVATGLLFDSGEREIPFSPAKLPSRP